ncbi:DUF6705 family protein [Riemerella columbipharyngis]|nr:DUF6705 family protein [Riemerella columbipharyngis]
MKKIILVFALMIICNINAQRTISLAQAYEYFKSPNGIPEDVSYVKDTNNDLNKFIGTWKGNYDGKTYIFRFIKKIKSGEYDIKWDYLVGKLKVTDNKGNILYNTFSLDDDKTYFSGTYLQHQSYIMDFIVNTYCNDSGVVFLRIYDNQPNKMKVLFDRDRTWYDPKKCPNYETYETTLPQKSFVLTKQ